jgi:tetratricopeptide (TPR) repeat protein
MNSIVKHFGTSYRKTALAFVLALVSLTLGVAQNQAFFEQGKERYRDGQYQEAINAWMQILDDGQHSSEVYYNLGNAHYKLNNIGPSIYYYEKALQLAPNDSDIKNNLAFAENARIDAIEPLPQSVFSRWYQNISGIMTFNGWAIATVIMTFLFALLFLLYWFSASSGRKRLFFTSSLVSVIIAIVAISMAYTVYGDTTSDTPAIVFAEETEIKSEPNLGSPTSFLLHEGTKVQILESEGNWIRISLVDGKDGWMPVSDVKRL